MISITIEGVPVSWLAHAGYGNRAFNPRFKHKKYTQFHIRDQFRGPMLQEAVSITYTFYMPIPKSTSKKKQAQMIIGLIHHTKKPDCSNMVKFYEDCLKKMVIYDDSQVIESISRKIYSEDPKTLIVIKPLVQKIEKDLHS